MENKLKNLEIIMGGLMSRYTERVPDVKKITDAMLEKGIIGNVAEIENDHVAFRTMGVPQLGIKSFEKIFLHYGYEKREYFYFEGKRLNAYWFAPPEPKFPRIFVSELIVDELSVETQQIIKKYTNEVVKDPVDSIDLNDPIAVDTFLHTPLWSTPTLEDYQALAKESEYASWVIFNRYYLNHYTISVHNLKEGYNTVALFNKFLESKGIKLNDAGGKIKESPDGGLLQSSTVAQLIDAEFQFNKKYIISGSYVEFAERRLLPQFKHLRPEEIKREHLRDGFETGNADKIFESTFSTQTKK